MTDAPDRNAVKAYLGQNGVSYSDAQIDDALAAETAAQARVCKFPIERRFWQQTSEGQMVLHEIPCWTDDLAEALLRRVARNLAMRAIPLGVQSDELGATRIGSTDPEVRRLEGPFRRRRVG